MSSSVTCITPVKLNETNFFKWSRCVKQYLKDQNQLHYLSDITPDPSNVVEYQQWKSDNVEILRSLFHSMEDTVYQLFRFCRTVSDLWVGLTVHYHDPRLLNFRKHQIYSEIFRTKQGKDQSLRDSASKFWALWDDFDSLYNQDVIYSELECSKAREKRKGNEHLIFNFLGILRPEQDHIKIMVLDINPLPSIDEVYDVAIAYDEGLEINDNRSKSLEEHVNKKRCEISELGARCNYCGHTNHSVSTCYKYREYIIRPFAR